MMHRYLSLLSLALLLAGPARAQVDYATVATEADLLDRGTLSEVEIDCMDYDAAADLFVFYNEATGDLVAYEPGAAPGSRTTIVRSNAQIDADRGSDVIDCRAIALDAGLIYAGLIYAGLSADHVDFVYKTAVDGATTSVLGDADGIAGLDVVEPSIFLSLVEFFGAPEGGSPTPSA